MALISMKVDIPSWVLDTHEVVNDVMKTPEVGEVYFDQTTQAIKTYGPYSDGKLWGIRVVILRKKWQWPTGFDGIAAMAREVGGSLFGYRVIPTENSSAFTTNGSCNSLGLICEWMHPSLNFPKPERWQDSLRINPNYTPPK